VYVNLIVFAVTFSERNIGITVVPASYIDVFKASVWHNTAVFIYLTVLSEA
jgi:hypothetical protein